MNLKYMRCVSLIMVVMLLLAGCNTTGIISKDSTDTIRIAMIPKKIGISYFDKCAEGAKVIADKYGMELIYKGPTTADAASQVNIVQDMIYYNVDIIAIAPIDPQAVKPILQKAQEKGIIVVTFDADSAEESRDVFVSQVSAEQLGKHIMDNMANLIGDSGKYAIITASMTADNQNEWIEWMMKYNEELYKDLKLLTIIPTDEDQQKAYANTHNLIQAYPELDGLIAMSTVAGPAAARAVETLGMSGDIQLYVLSLPNDIREYINSGSVQVATLWDPYELGGLTVEIAHKLLNGETIIDNEKIGGFGPIIFDEENSIVIMGEPLDFDKSNIDEYDF